MPTVASGQITLIDINDAKVLGAYLSSNQPKIQIYDPNNGSYTPNWTTSNVVVTPELYVSGVGTNIIDDADSITWYEAGSNTPISTGNGYTVGTKTLTITTNKLSTRNSLVIICEIKWTDPDFDVQQTVKAEIEFAKVSSGQKGDKGDKGDQGIQGPPGADGKQYYTWLKYADDASGTNMSDSPTGKAYMGLAVNKTTATESTNPADYTWSKIEGDQGVQGPKGADGQTTYTWVKYADNASGGGMSDSPTGKAYIGFAYNKTTPTESTTASDYSWSLIKGADGKNSVITYCWTPNGSVIKNGSGTLTAQCDVYDGTTKITSGVTYQWYKLVSGTWTKLDSTTNFGTTGYTTSTLTIPAGAIDSASSFKCVATYNSKTYEDVVSVADQTDPIQVVPIALEGNMFKNGEGTKNVTAKLYRNGAEIDSGGTLYTYKWYKRDKDGAIDPNFGGTGVNYKTGKTITFTSSEIYQIASLICEIDK